ncbi:hypothetical protein [Prauserella shujinwangii]|uniref:hypothetical protein n=1 Tax=Prauserella shujinwangii TaxID=1453103 RepID=UPI003CCC2EC0
MPSVSSVASATVTTAAKPVRRSPVSGAVRSALPSSALDTRAAGIRRTEGGQLVWRVQCGDLISRERCVTVFVDDGQVVLVGPPGETARLTAGQLGQLRAALNEAAKMAER